MWELIFGVVVCVGLFHAIQWYAQVKGMGGSPVLFKFFKN